MCECLGGKPEREMKVNVGGMSSRTAPSTGLDSFLKDLSKSTFAGTRKMVNYA